jgi:transposase-like protein
MSERAVELVANLVRSHKVDGRRSYDRQAKTELIRRCLEPGVSVAGAALTHGLNANLLRKWIKDATLGSQRKRLALPAPAKLLAVTHRSAPRLTTPSDGYLEILVRGVTLRVHGRIDPSVLRQVLDVLATRA